MSGSIKDLYDNNADFKRYVDESMRVVYKDRQLEDVLELAITKEVAKQYASAIPGDSSKSTYNPVCECV